MRTRMTMKVTVTVAATGVWKVTFRTCVRVTVRERRIVIGGYINGGGGRDVSGCAHDDCGAVEGEDEVTGNGESKGRL